MSAALARLEAAQRLLQRLVSAPDAQAVLASLSNDDPSSALAPGASTAGLSSADMAALRQLDPRRLLVYRRLIHGTLRDTFGAQLTRTAGRLGTERIGKLVEDFCAAQLPRSQVLRDVAFEMCSWAQQRWTNEIKVAPFMGDLARFELMEFDVYAGERQPFGWPAARAGELQPDLGVAFDGSMRLLQLSWRVHELPDDADDISEPSAGPLSLLAYRDAEGSYRQLELTPLAEAMLLRLWRGEALGASITGACEALAEPLNQRVIDGISAVLADLAERGVVLGAAAAGVREAPSPWAFRLHSEAAFVAPPKHAPSANTSGLDDGKSRRDNVTAGNQAS